MFRGLLVAVGTLVLTAGAASALTIVNEDAKEYTLRVDQGAKESTHKIPANETVKLQDVCQAGCGLNGPWFYAWMADAGDTVTIKNGEPLAMGSAAVGAGSGAPSKSETPRATEGKSKKTK